MGGDFAPAERVGVGDLLVDFFVMLLITVTPAPLSESPDVLPFVPPGAGAAIAPRSEASEETSPPKVAVLSVELLLDIAPPTGEGIMCLSWGGIAPKQVIISQPRVTADNLSSEVIGVGSSRTPEVDWVAQRG